MKRIGAGLLAIVVVAGLIAGLMIWTRPAPYIDIINTEEKLYSQWDEELVIRDFFQDRKNGVFLDIGCAWPIQANTTYYLEKHLGWTGISVDANAVYLPRWQHDRPGSVFLSYLVSDHSGTMDTFYAAGALGSVINNRTLNNYTISGREIEVPTITIDDLLDQREIDSIDFLSMDIEESEPAALAGFDIKRFKPKLVCIEASPSIRTAILEYFEANDYERIERYLEHDAINWYFTPKSNE